MDGETRFAKVPPPVVMFMKETFSNTFVVGPESHCAQDCPFFRISTKNNIASTTSSPSYCKVVFGNVGTTLLTTLVIQGTADSVPTSAAVSTAKVFF